MTSSSAGWSTDTTERMSLWGWSDKCSTQPHTSSLLNIYKCQNLGFPFFLSFFILGVGVKTHRSSDSLQVNWCASNAKTLLSINIATKLTLNGSWVELIWVLKQPLQLRIKEAVREGISEPNWIKKNKNPHSVPENVEYDEPLKSPNRLREISWDVFWVNWRSEKAVSSCVAFSILKI